jgi:hypothetical protein
MSFGRGMPSQGKRQPIRAATINAGLRAASGLLKLRTGPGLLLRWLGDTPLIELDPAAGGGVALARASGSIGPASVSLGVITYAVGSAVLYDDDGTTLTPRAATIEVHSDLEETIPNGSRLRLGRVGGKWWVLGYLCPAS